MTPLTIFLYALAWSVTGYVAFSHIYCRPDSDKWITNSWLEVFFRILPYGPFLWVAVVQAYGEVFIEDWRNRKAALNRAEEIMARIKKSDEKK